MISMGELLKCLLHTHLYKYILIEHTSQNVKICDLGLVHIKFDHIFGLNNIMCKHRSLTQFSTFTQLLIRSLMQITDFENLIQ